MKYRAPRFLFRRYELLRRVNPGERFIEIGAADLSLKIGTLLGPMRCARGSKSRIAMS